MRVRECGRDHPNAPVSTSGTCKGQCVLETYFRGDPWSPGPALGLVDSKGAAALELHTADPQSPPPLQPHRVGIPWGRAISRGLGPRRWLAG